MSSADCTIYTLDNSNLQSHLLWDNSAYAYSAAAIANHYKAAFSIHQAHLFHCLHELRLVKNDEAFPDTSTHDQQRESNPRPFDLESNALSTKPHDPR